MSDPRSTGQRIAGFLTVALAAAMWGTDGVLRGSLALDLPAATVVAHEHLLLVLLTAPWVPGALRAFRSLAPRGRVAVLVIGAGSSAVATTLFTAAFAYGDPTTPLLLQKLQPLLAVVLAALVLGERPRRRLLPLASLALLGAYLISFPDPTSVAISQLAPALLALGAAALWAGGTVLGRAVAPDLATMHLTALRFLVGLPVAMLLATWQLGMSGLVVTRGDLVPLVALALGPGLLAMGLYYRGLRVTPATLATFAELAFPLTAVTLGALVLGRPLATSQLVGAALLVAAITLLALATGGRTLVDRAPAPVVPTPGPPPGEPATSVAR